MNQQQDFDPRAFACEAVLEGVAVAMGFQITDRQLDLHASRIRATSCCAPRSFSTVGDGMKPRSARPPSSELQNCLAQRVQCAPCGAPTCCTICLACVAHRPRGLPAERAGPRHARTASWRRRQDTDIAGCFARMSQGQDHQWCTKNFFINDSLSLTCNCPSAPVIQSTKRRLDALPVATMTKSEKLIPA